MFELTSTGIIVKVFNLEQYFNKELLRVMLFDEEDFSNDKVEKLLA